MHLDPQYERQCSRLAKALLQGAATGDADSIGAILKGITQRDQLEDTVMYLLGFVHLDAADILADLLDDDEGDRMIDQTVTIYRQLHGGPT